VIICYQKSAHVPLYFGVLSL